MSGFSDGVNMKEAVSMGLVPIEEKPEIKKILVTGCCGFIGSAFVKQVIFTSQTQIVGLSRNTDQKNLKRLEYLLTEPESFPHFKLVFQDINDANLTELLEGVDVVVNFSAKTFVDYSVRDPKPFIQSNIDGVFNLLEAVRKNPVKLFVQISTDEVYGPCFNGEPPHKETSQMNPTNPYSATKACAEMLCMGYAQTYKIPMLITRTENNYGFFQHPQKVIPTWVKKALANEPLPIYGDGKQRRMWLRVEDNVDALLTLIQGLHTGVFNIAGGQELENIELAKIIIKRLGKGDELLNFIDDSKIRPNHDRRYAMDTTKIYGATGWQPKWDLVSGIENAVDWYVANQWWFI
jgi:dTDP-glucose 4,6-dehydratase